MLNRVLGTTLRAPAAHLHGPRRALVSAIRAALIGTVGVWFDPNDFARYMAGKGPELLSNGDFSGGLIGWSVIGTNSTAQVVNGELEITATSGNFPGRRQVATTVVGRTYMMVGTARRGTSASNAAISIGTVVATFTGTSNETKTATFVATSTTTNIDLTISSATASGTAYFDNVSVYELTDINSCTLFQDAAGTTPVTAVEQPVGLILDKSKGLVRGASVAATNVRAFFNSGGATDNTLINHGDGTYTVNSGSTLRTVFGPVANLIGKPVEVELEMVNAVAGSYSCDWTDAMPVPTFSSWSNGQKRTFIGTHFLSTGEGSFVDITNASGSPARFRLPVVRELPGNHASQSTAASRPVLTARKNLLTYSEDLTNAAWAKVGSSVVANASGTLDKIVESALTETHAVTHSVTPVVAGQVVTASARLKAGERTQMQIDLPNSAVYGGINPFVTVDLGTGQVIASGAGATATSITSLGNGEYRVSLTATATAAGNTGVRIYLYNAGTTYAGNGASGAYAGEMQFEPGSTATRYQRVTTATDYDWQGFPLSLKFDGVDDWLQTGSIDFTNTDKMTVVAGVTKLSDAAVGMPCELSANANANTGAFRLTTGNPANTYEAVSYGGATSSAVSPATYTPPVASVIAMSASITADQLILRANGTQVASSVSDQGAASSYGNYPLYIGRRGGTSLPFNGQLYGLAIIGKLLADVGPAEREINKNLGVTLP